MEIAEISSSQVLCPLLVSLDRAKSGAGGREIVAKPEDACMGLDQVWSVRTRQDMPLEVYGCGRWIAGM